MPQRVEKEYIQTPKPFHAFGRYAAVIGKVGGIAESEAVRQALAMVEPDGLNRYAADGDRFGIEDVYRKPGTAGFRRDRRNTYRKVC